jgi:hypothetical protein
MKSHLTPKSKIYKNKKKISLFYVIESSIPKREFKSINHSYSKEVVILSTTQNNVDFGWCVYLSSSKVNWKTNKNATIDKKIWWTYSLG